MCHGFRSDTGFYQLLFRIDQSIAEEEQQAGCSCGGVLHSARYPRKPRGFRSELDESYDYRLSFCCAKDGCRRRTTPPSVRFPGRKVYPGWTVQLHYDNLEARILEDEALGPLPSYGTIRRYMKARGYHRRRSPKT